LRRTPSFGPESTCTGNDLAIGTSDSADMREGRDARVLDRELLRRRCMRANPRSGHRALTHKEIDARDNASGAWHRPRSVRASTR
jgi:hypothetical protein